MVRQVNSKSSEFLNTMDTCSMNVLFTCITLIMFTQFEKNNGKPLTWGEIFELDQERLTVIKTEFGVTEVEVIYECEFYRDYIHHDGCHHNRWEEYIRTFPDRQAHLLDQKAKSESEILRMVNKYYPTTPFCTRILLVFFKDT